MKKYERGVHFGLPEAHYFGAETIEWVNRSKIVKIDQLTAAELLDCDYTMSSSTALRVGSAVHQRWLEDKAPYIVIDNIRNKAGQELKRECLREGKEYLSTTELGQVNGLVDGLEGSAKCMKLKDNFVGAEITICDDDYNGIKSKIRLDAFTKDGYIVDLKTTSADITVESLRETFEKFGYKYQVVMYLDIAKKFAKELGVKEVKGFKFVFVSKNNNKAAVVTVDQLDFEPIREELKEKCARLKAKLANHENGVEAEEIELELYETPNYLKMKDGKLILAKREGLTDL